MGLPLWRDPDEAVATKAAIKTDPTAAARSPIRRRASVHGRRGNRPRLQREISRRPTQLNRSTTPPSQLPELISRGNEAGVPPIATLLESADRPPAVPPAPPAPDARSRELRAFDARERELRNDIAQLQDRAARLDREAREIGFDLSDITGDLSAREENEMRALLEEGARSVVQMSRRLSPPTSAARASAARGPGPAIQRSDHRAAPSSNPALDQGLRTRTSTLPTPPHDISEDHESLFLPEQAASTIRAGDRGSRPPSHSWRPESPINGLGDRNRSPTPGDGWETMRTTIAPDATLPSADSSFTSAAASQSFSSHRTELTEPDRSVPSETSDRTSAGDNQSDSASSIDPDDLVCNDEEREATASFAQDMYWHERTTHEGMERIARHRHAHAAEGNRFLLSGEPDCVEIGFRLINEALDSPEGRERVFQLSQNRTGPDGQDFEQWIFRHRRDRSRTRGAHITDGPLETAPEDTQEMHESRRIRLEQWSERQRARARHRGISVVSQDIRDSLSAVNAARSQLDDYLRRHNPDMLRDSASTNRTSSTPASPPPRYEPLASQPDANTFTSRDAPEAHAVSPPSARSERDVGDALLSGDEQDLDAVRRVVQRLAQREDVPDEWWMRMGLNLSRTRVRSRSPESNTRAGESNGSAWARVRSGRVERRGDSSRL